jgi:hypothetical protein
LVERILAGIAPLRYNEFLQMLRGLLQVIDVEDVDAKPAPERRTLVSLIRNSSLKQVLEAVGLLYATRIPNDKTSQCSVDICLQEVEDGQRISSRLYERVPKFTAEVQLGAKRVTEILFGAELHV